MPSKAIQSCNEQPCDFVIPDQTLPGGNRQIEGRWYAELHSEERRGFTMTELNGSIGGKVSPHCACANAPCLSYTDNNVSEEDINIGSLGCDKFAAGVGE
jgi:hypothetical protein